MKTGFSPTRILLAIAVAAALGMGTACRQHFDEHLPTTNGGHLEIDLESGDINVKIHHLDSVRLEANVRGMNAHAVEFELSQQPDSIALRSAQRGWRSGLFQDPDTTITAWVPPHTSLSLRSRRGDVAVSDIRGTLAIETDRGEVEARNIDGPTTIEGHRGKITIDDVSGAVHARNTQGAIKVRGARARVTADSDSGSISVAFDTVPAGHLVSRLGGVAVGVPEIEGASLDAFESRDYVVVQDTNAAEGSASVSGEATLLVDSPNSGIRLGTRTHNFERVAANDR